MRKYYMLFLAMVVFASANVYGQGREISGKVTADDGSDLPGVSVFVQGTTLGTTSNFDGTYRLTVPSGADLLTFSFIGFNTQTLAIGSRSTIDVVLTTSAMLLTEAVVTGAYGTQRSSRSTSYSAQVVDDQQLNTIRQPNLNNSLAGKVAGLQVRSQSAAALGRQTEVRLRGASGLGTGSGALYVVDGTILPNADDINLDDIESVSVLQGPAASAQFGSQGADGAIVITLKRGRKTNGIGLTFNLGAQFERVNILPNYQNSYAGGASGDLIKYSWKNGDPEEWQALDGKYYHDYNDDASWGPRMVGQEYIPWYAWYGGHSRSYQTATLDPQPDNARDFYETGVVLNNSVSFSTATEKLTFKATYSNLSVNGLIPTSKLGKNVFGLKSTYELNKHLEVSANINYVNWRLEGEIDDGYSNQSTGAFSQWFHRDLDMGIMKELRDLRTPEGIYASWNKANPNTYDPGNPRSFYAANYWYNPYSYYDLIDQIQSRDRLFGDIALTYKVNDDLKLKATYRKQQNTTWHEVKYSSQLNESGLQTTGNNPMARGFYETGTSYSDRQNMELMATYNKTIQDFTIDGFVGADFFRWTSKSNGAYTNQGLSVPDLFTIANSVNDPTILNGRAEEKYRALFGNVSLGYRNMVFLEGTLRNDWFSTLPPDNNAVLSKSLGASFVFSDVIGKDSPWFSYGKLRVSWGEIPQALGTASLPFGAYRYPGFAYGVGQFKWGNNYLMSTPNELVDPHIKGTVISQREIGTDLRFIQDRIGLSVTYFDGTSSGFPYSLSINGASGFTSLLTNVGKITKKGLELKLDVTPVDVPNFKWQLLGTYSNLFENNVIEISEKYGIDRTNSLGGVWGTVVPYMVHAKGQRWGQLYGNAIARNDEGVPILDANGFYTNTPDYNYGSVLPRVTGGVQNTFNFLKDFTLFVNFDYQVGGKFASLSNMWGSYSGLTARTARLNDKGNSVRDAVADGGGIRMIGVAADGAAVDTYVEAQDYYHNIFGNKTFDEFVYDLTFVKLRELSLEYNLPVKKLGLSKHFQSASFAVVARNPVLIYAKSRDFDPSEISTIYGETGQLPGTRSIGFNLRMAF